MNPVERILLTGSALWCFGEGMLGPFYAVFAQSIGGSIMDISIAWSIYLFAIGTITIFFGKYSDNLKKEQLMVLGFALNAFFTFGYLFVSNPIQLFIIQFGLGLAAAFALPAWDALYAKHEDRKKAGVAWGLAEGMPRIITGIAIIIGGLIVSYASFSQLFMVMGTIQIVAAIYQTKILSVEK